MARCAAALLVVGCSSPARAPAAPRAFSCHGPASIAREERWDGLPSGRLDVHRLDSDTRQPLDEVRLRVLAEGVPLPAFAGALSDALGLPVVVEEGSAATRIAIAFPEIDVLGLWRVLANEQYTSVSLYEGTIHFTQSYGTGLGALDDPAPPPPEWPGLVTRLVAPSVDPEQFASAFCEQIASPRGSASVLGARVLLSDTSMFLDRAEALLDKLRTEAERVEGRRP